MKQLVIHTGGTIGMTRTSDGFAPCAGVVEQALSHLHQQGDMAALPDVLQMAPLIDSAQITPMDWNRIAEAVFERADQYDSVVVTHGTDTLAHTSAALCMALINVQIPVIVTGAMLPLTVDGSDGWRNLGDALKAGDTAEPGVWVQFAGQRLHGGRVRKSHSSALDAFEAAEGTGVPRRIGAAPSLSRLSSHKVSIFSITPGPFTEQLRFAAQTCEGIVLRCYGSGTAPDTPDMRAALSLARDRDVPVLAVSQCPEGGMKMGIYAAGRVLRDCAVIDGRDMTLEMAYTKLHYALSETTDAETRHQFLAQALCGELTPPE